MFTASVIVPYSLSVKNEEGDVENPWPLVVIDETGDVLRLKQ